MDTYIDLYIYDLKTKQEKSENTLAAYKRDINEFCAYLKEQGLRELSEITNADIVSFMMKLKNEGRSGATVNRKMASIRSFCTYLVSEDVLDSNPAQHMKAPKIEKKAVEYLTIEEVEALLNAPDDSVKGIRDRAVLELMYGTGIRVTEVTELRMTDMNFRIGFITCSGQFGKARIIPLGSPCRKALENYVNDARPQLLGSVHQAEDLSDVSPTGNNIADDGSDTAEEFVFLNMRGEKLTRQGLWKIVKGYAEKTGIADKLMPQTLRNSFAVHMIQNGADLKSIQELMGYEDATAAQIYLSATKNRIKEVYDRTHPRA